MPGTRFFAASQVWDRGPIIGRTEEQLELGKRLVDLVGHDSPGVVGITGIGGIGYANWFVTKALYSPG